MIPSPNNQPDFFNWIQYLLPPITTLFYYASSAYLAVTARAGSNTASLSRATWKAPFAVQTGILIIYGLEAIVLIAGHLDSRLPTSEPHTMFTCGSVLSWAVMVLGIDDTPGNVSCRHRPIWWTYAIGENILLSNSFPGSLSSHWYSTFHTTAQSFRLLLLLVLLLSGRHIDEERRPVLDSHEDSTAEKETIAYKAERILRVWYTYLWPKGEPWLQVRVLQIVLITGLEMILSGVIPRQINSMSDDLNMPYRKLKTTGIYGLLRFLHESVMPKTRSYLWDSLEATTVKKLSVDAYHNIMHLSMDYHENMDSVDISRRIERTKFISHFAHFMFINIIPKILHLLSTATFMIGDFGYYVGLVVAGVLLTVTEVSRVIANRQLSSQKDFMAVSLEQERHLIYSLTNWLYIWFFNQVDAEEDKYAGLVHQTQTLRNRMRYWENIGQLAPSLIYMVGCLATYVIVFPQVLKGDGAPSEALRLITYWDGLSACILSVFSTTRDIGQRANYLEDSLKLYEKQTATTDKTPLEIIYGVVELENVHFRALEGISFKSAPGQTVGCVGRNGAGKTTMLQLLCGLYNPRRGSVKIDGQNLTKVATGSLREHIYFSTQTAPKFGKTVRENLQYCAPQTTAKEIDEAATVVGLTDMMDVDDKKLSSGELQKLAIARALVRNPTILLLDEPMSALDNIAQQAIRHMLRKLTSGRTTFIVAHQLMTVQSADIILVFEKGQIVQQGTHEELVRSEGLYRELWVAEHGFI